jgi:hypothetical protein
VTSGVCCGGGALLQAEAQTEKTAAAATDLRGENVELMLHDSDTLGVAFRMHLLVCYRTVTLDR